MFQATLLNTTQWICFWTFPRCLSMKFRLFFSSVAKLARAINISLVLCEVWRNVLESWIRETKSVSVCVIRHRKTHVYDFNVHRKDLPGKRFVFVSEYTPRSKLEYGSELDNTTWIIQPKLFEYGYMYSGRTIYYYYDVEEDEDKYVSCRCVCMWEYENEPGDRRSLQLDNSGQI